MTFVRGLVVFGFLALGVGCGGIDESLADPNVEEALSEDATVTSSEQGVRANYKICAGGYAPVSYWNPSGCGGVHAYYPQGTHGWIEDTRWGGCNTINSRYFHPHNGWHGGWIESWRLCRY